MALPTKKTPPRDALADLTIMIYGAPKIGKSTLCSQFPSPLFLATEAGLNHLDAFQAPIRSWGGVDDKGKPLDDSLLGKLAELASVNHEFRTVIIDTIDIAFRLCSEYSCAKLGITHESEADYGKGWASTKTEFQRVMTKMTMLPFGVVFVSHAKQIEMKSRTATYDKTVPTIDNQGRNIALGMSDMILFADLEVVKGKEPRRVLRTNPADTYEAGDRTGRLPATIDLSYSAFADAFTKTNKGKTK